MNIMILRDKTMMMHIIILGIALAECGGVFRYNIDFLYNITLL